MRTFFFCTIVEYSTKIVTVFRVLGCLRFDNNRAVLDESIMMFSTEPTPLKKSNFATRLYNPEAEEIDRSLLYSVAVLNCDPFQSLDGRTKRCWIHVYDTVHSIESYEN